MAVKLHFAIVSYFCTLAVTAFSQNLQQFTYNGFQQAKLHLDGGATIHPNGLLQLTNTSKQLSAHAFLPVPLKFDSPESLSFSSTLAFAMYPEIQAISGHGIVFVLSPTMNFHLATPGKYFGLFNASTVGNSSNHIFGVELDTIQDFEFGDIDSNHVGININNLQSNASASAGYFSDTDRQNKNLTLLSAKPMQIWVDYDDRDMVVNVTMAPLGVFKPSKPLLSSHVNLSEIVLDTMYVGLSSSTGSVASSHYVLGWSFSQGRETPAGTLNVSKLPSLPRFGSRKQILSVGSVILVVVISAMAITVGLVFYLRWRKKFVEIVEDWEQQYYLQRFSYRDLYRATKGFDDKELLGSGGFGRVYKGKLPSTKLEVAIKKMSYGSNQGIREFVAEIACMGRLRHRNLVQLLGYCRRQGELLLVYDYMPNGSLDKYLYGDGKPVLSWSERFRIIKGVASALAYLHEGWEQVVVHRDVKASNVLLDAKMNARLGDFGLARLYDHGTNPQTTHVVGTVGYLAPELTRKGKATTRTDVFSFGIFILEVASGRTPISLQGDGQQYLARWVHDCWKRGMITEACDHRMEGCYVVEEIVLILKLGILCSHRRPEARPSMRQIIQFLDGDSTLPDIAPFDVKPAYKTTGTQIGPSFTSSSDCISTSFSVDFRSLDECIVLVM